jgi:hypothetical protein
MYEEHYGNQQDWAKMNEQGALLWIIRYRTKDGEPAIWCRSTLGRW